jgi:hypothetical protein
MHNRQQPRDPARYDAAPPPRLSRQNAAFKSDAKETQAQHGSSSSALPNETRQHSTTVAPCTNHYSTMSTSVRVPILHPAAAEMQRVRS